RTLHRRAVPHPGDPGPAARAYGALAGCSDGDAGTGRRTRPERPCLARRHRANVRARRRATSACHGYVTSRDRHAWYNRREGADRMGEVAEDTTDDWEGELLAPLAAQWWPPHALRPEQRLLRAVLEEALAELAAGRMTAPSPLDNHHRRELLDW